MELAYRIECEFGNEVRSYVWRTKSGPAGIKLGATKCPQSRRISNGRAARRAARVLFRAVQGNGEGCFAVGAVYKAHFGDTSPNQARLVIYIYVLAKEDVSRQRRNPSPARSNQAPGLASQHFPRAPAHVNPVQA